MDRVELCKKVQECTVRVLAVGDDRVLKHGSGVFFHPRGLVLTAGHVVCDRDNTPIGERIIVPGEPENVEYKIVPDCGFKIEINIEGVENVEPDIRILEPKKDIIVRDYLPLSEDIMDIGNKVIISGFPEESLSEIDERSIIETDDSYDSYYEYSRLEREILALNIKNMMLKHGMVGSKDIMNLGNIDMSTYGIEEGVDIEWAYYGIDNHLSEGGSGGAVVNMDGELEGVIIKRTKIELKSDALRLLPSGTGVAVSHHLATWVLDHQ